MGLSNVHWTAALVVRKSTASPAIELVRVDATTCSLEYIGLSRILRVPLALSLSDIFLTTGAWEFLQLQPVDLRISSDDESNRFTQVLTIDF